jgi:hypothetical protein
MRTVNRFRFVPPVMTAALMLLAASADGQILMPLDEPFTTAPSGAGPWATVEFGEIGGGVRMSVTSHLAPGETITRLLINVAEPTAGVQILNTNTTGPAWQQVLGKLSNPASTLAFHAPGGGYFDFRIDWQPGVFTGGQVFTMNFIGAQYTTGMFNVFSEPNSGGVYRAAALVHGSQGEIGWVGNIPAPSAALALAGGLVAFGRRRRS